MNGCIWPKYSRQTYKNQAKWVLFPNNPSYAIPCNDIIACWNVFYRQTDRQTDRQILWRHMSIFLSAKFVTSLPSSLTGGLRKYLDWRRKSLIAWSLDKNVLRKTKPNMFWTTYNKRKIPIKVNTKPVLSLITFF